MCLYQLAERATELNHVPIASMLYTIVGSTIAGEADEIALTAMMVEHARQRIAMLDVDIEQDGEDDDDGEE